MGEVEKLKISMCFRIWCVLFFKKCFAWYLVLAFVIVKVDIFPSVVFHPVPSCPLFLSGVERNATSRAE